MAGLPGQPGREPAIVEQAAHAGDERLGFIGHQEVVSVPALEPLAALRRRDHRPIDRPGLEDLQPRAAAVPQLGTTTTALRAMCAAASST